MQVEIIKDKESVIYRQNIYKKGDVLAMDDSIAASLMKRGYVKPVDSEGFKLLGSEQQTAPDGTESDMTAEKAAEDKQGVAGHLDRAQLESMQYFNLKKLAKDMGVDANGTKVELIDRIVAETVYIDNAAEADEFPDTSMPE